MHLFLGVQKPALGRLSRQLKSKALFYAYFAKATSLGPSGY